MLWSLGYASQAHCQVMLLRNFNTTPNPLITAVLSCMFYDFIVTLFPLIPYISIELVNCFQLISVFTAGSGVCLPAKRSSNATLTFQTTVHGNFMLSCYGCRQTGLVLRFESLQNRKPCQNQLLDLLMVYTSNKHWMNTCYQLVTCNWLCNGLQIFRFSYPIFRSMLKFHLTLLDLKHI